MFKNESSHYYDIWQNTKENTLLQVALKRRENLPELVRLFRLMHASAFWLLCRKKRGEREKSLNLTNSQVVKLA